MLTESSATRSGRQLLTFGAVVVALGLGLVGTVGGIGAQWVLLAGWVVLVFGLHRYGRSGAPDAP